MNQRLLLTAILFVACSISVAAQESRWSLKPNGGITVATLSGDKVEERTGGLSPCDPGRMRNGYHRGSTGANQSFS